MGTFMDTFRRLVAAVTDSLMALAGGLFGATAGSYFSFHIAAGQQADSAAAAETGRAVALFERSAEQFERLADLSGFMCVVTAAFVLVLHLARSALRDSPTSDAIATAVVRELRTTSRERERLENSLAVHAAGTDRREPLLRTTDALGWPGAPTQGLAGD